MKWYSRFDEVVNNGDQSSFTLIKTVRFPVKLNKDLIDKKYGTLQGFGFDKVHIPNFSYEVTKHEIVYHIEFIKGTQLNPISFMNHKKIIYENLVDNDKEWGFHDLHPEDFIVEDNTNKLYLVDFESFEKMTFEEKVNDYNKNIKNILLNLDKIKKDLDTIHMNDFWKW